jgi:hypothetical protein
MGAMNEGYEGAISFIDSAGEWDRGMRGIGALRLALLLVQDGVGRGEGVKVASGIGMPSDTKAIGV